MTMIVHSRVRGERGTNVDGATCPRGASALTARLIGLIEGDGLSVAAAARAAGVEIAAAGVLVRLCAIEREAQEAELEERLDEIQALCPGEDWWSYTPQQLDAILAGESIPNRIVRELAHDWCERTGNSLGRLATEADIDSQRLRRLLGLCPLAAKVGRRKVRRQRTVTVQCAARIVRAMGIPPCEVPGL